jgi:GGDEF domain-containing protein
MTDAMHDPDTGLPARALALDRLRLALARSARTGAPVSVLHLTVDAAAARDPARMRAIGGHLAAAVRLADTVGRIAPDGFLIVCEGMVELQAGALADRLRRAVAAAGGDTNASVGIARSRSGAQAEELLDEASAAAIVDETLRRGRADLPPPGPLPHQREDR